MNRPVAPAFIDIIDRPGYLLLANDLIVKEAELWVFDIFEFIAMYPYFPNPRWGFFKQSLRQAIDCLVRRKGEW